MPLPALLSPSSPPGLEGTPWGDTLQTAWVGSGSVGPQQALGAESPPPHPILDRLPDSERPVSFAISGSHITRSRLPHPWHQEFLFTLRTGERGYGKAASDWVTSHSKTTGSVTPPRTSGGEPGFAWEGAGLLFWPTRLWRPPGEPGARHSWSAACRDGPLVYSKELGKAWKVTRSYGQD